MASGSTASAVRQIGMLFGPGTVAGLTDGQLLERFLARRDEGAEVAFAALVARHGPMVLGVCRRALPDPGDADDAFQATFLVLVRRARSVRVDDSLGRWLYGVSRRVAARARVLASRRNRSGSAGLEAVAAGSNDPDRFEARAILDEELARLPQAYRSAVVLCDLDGLTHEEAARDLRCPVGTIKSRLNRGRARLRDRLERRGLAPSMMLLAPAVPARLAEAAARVAAISGGSSAAGLVPASAVALAEGMLKAMIGIKLKLAAAALLSVGVGVAATGSGVMARQDPAGEKPHEAGAPVRPAATRPPAAEPARSAAAKLDEIVSFNFRDVPLADAVANLQQTGANIVLDPKAFVENGLTRESKVSMVATEIKLSTALRYLLEPLGLAHQVVADAILITSQTTLDRDAKNRLTSDMSRELERARRQLAKVERTAGNPQDPAVIRSRSRVALLEDISAQLHYVLAKAVEAFDEKPESVDVGGRGRTRWPEKADRNDPRELKKVSLPNYVIEQPDVIVVEVLEALPGRPITGERLVRPDGTISLGFYGDLNVAGLTINEAKSKVATHLRTWVSDEKLGLTRPNPGTGKPEPVDPARTDRVFVDVTSYNSKVYYVQGEVATPGRLPVTGSETVLDAINYAGGLTPRADKRSIRLVRPMEAAKGPERYLPVDFAAIVDRGDPSTNYQLMPGDRLVVARDAKAPPESPVPPEVEARLQNVERKLDEVLKALERLPKP